jgi:hypothetical protein
MKCFLVTPVFDEPGTNGSVRDDWNLENRSIIEFERKGTGERRKHPDEFGPGAMWFAIWYPINFEWQNEAGPHLIVVLPNGRLWDIDDRANNCTLPNDATHRCWVRHGETPLVTVDKAGPTCAAGAGSIIAGDYHGFLRNGEFVNA